MSDQHAEDRQERLADRKKSAERQEAAAYNQYVGAVDNTVDSLKGLRNTVKKSKQAAIDADAETQAAEATAEGGIVSITEALRMIDTEKETRAEHRSHEMEYAKQALKSAGSLAASGVRVIAGAASASSGDIKDGMKSGALTMLAGAGLGMLMNQGELRDMAMNGIVSFISLGDKNPTEDGVTEKFVDGMATPDDYVADLAVRNGDGQTYPDGEGNGEQAPDRELSEPDGYKPPEGSEATEMSGEEMGEMADLSSWLDKAASALEERGGTTGKVLATAVSVIGDVALEGGGGQHASDIMARLLEETRKIDENEENKGKEAGQEGPGYPGA